MENHSDISKNFIPYDLAIKLKELGFDEVCLAKYQKIVDGENYQLQLLQKERNCNRLDTAISAPLWQQAFDWFREKYNLDSYVRKTTYKQWKLQINYLLQDDSPEEWEKYKSYQDYKDTQEEARQACLEKLVELVKRRS